MAKQKTNGKDPAVLLYTQDFIVGTLTMTDEQRGKYILLLCYQHQKQNKLTLNDLKLADGDETILEKFPQHSDGYYYNDRMAMEIENRKIRTDASRNNGKLGGRPKTQKTQVVKNKPMGYDLVNLKETKIKPKQNLSGTGTGNENAIASESANVSYKLVDKMFDKLLDVTTFSQGYSELLEDFGTIDKALDVYTDDLSVRNNWIRQINNKLDILV
jgi:uncharacterized protein YdaU (DUF1376 family)